MKLIKMILNKQIQVIFVMCMNASILQATHVPLSPQPLSQALLSMDVFDDPDQVTITRLLHNSLLNRLPHKPSISQLFDAIRELLGKEGANIALVTQCLEFKGIDVTSSRCNCFFGRFSLFHDHDSHKTPYQAATSMPLEFRDQALVAVLITLGANKEIRDDDEGICIVQ